MEENAIKNDIEKQKALLKISTGLTPEHELGEKYMLR
jgi:hypothetical protein